MAAEFSGKKTYKNPKIERKLGHLQK